MNKMLIIESMKKKEIINMTDRKAAGRLERSCKKVARHDWSKFWRVFFVWFLWYK